MAPQRERALHSLPLGFTCAILLAGCTVGPHHVEPQPALREAFDQAETDVPETDVPGSATLWNAFGSRELDGLLSRVALANPSLVQALARVDETRALAGLAPYAYVPTVGIDAGEERRRESLLDPLAPEPTGRTETWRAGFDAAWEIDLFGSLRNRARSANRLMEAEAATVEAVRQSLLAEAAQAWFALVGARQKRDLLGLQHRNLEESVRILQAQLEAGRASALDVASSLARARTVAASLPAAESEIVRHEQRLAVLTAWSIDELRTRLDPAATMPELPVYLHAGTPEQWLRRRPDIRAAERRLAAATADIGVEVAEYFPKLELLGGFGWTAGSAEDLGTRQAERWSYGPSLTWRLLDAGRVRQAVKAAEARRDFALASYREVVLRALEETENALAALRATQQSAMLLELAVQAAGEAEALAALRFSSGSTDYLVLLDAERTRLELAERLVETRTGRATALAAVYKALAGSP